MTLQARPALRLTCHGRNSSSVACRWSGGSERFGQVVGAGIGVLRPVRQLLLVYEQHGGPWDWSKGLHKQESFDEHARFVDGLVEEGFIILGGRLTTAMCCS